MFAVYPDSSASLKHYPKVLTFARVYLGLFFFPPLMVYGAFLNLSHQTSCWPKQKPALSFSGARDVARSKRTSARRSPSPPWAAQKNQGIMNWTPPSHLHLHIEVTMGEPWPSHRALGFADNLSHRNLVLLFFFALNDVAWALLILS